jgi:hypothetical protein
MEWAFYVVYDPYGFPYALDYVASVASKESMVWTTFVSMMHLCLLL